MAKTGAATDTNGATSGASCAWEKAITQNESGPKGSNCSFMAFTPGRLGNLRDWQIVARSIPYQNDVARSTGETPQRTRPFTGRRLETQLPVGDNSLARQ